MTPASSNPGPYSLPDRDKVQLSAEDDWTRVKGRKEKRRIQNRVAQRSYRSRMKARLGELQSQLQAHEEQKAKGEAEHRDPSPPSPPSSSPATGLHIHTTPPFGLNAGTKETKPSSVNSASPPTPADVIGDLDPSQYAKAIDQLSHQVDMGGNDDSQWFLDSTSLLEHGDTSSYIQPSVPTPLVSIGQCPPMPAHIPEEPRNPSYGPTSLSQSILQDFFRFQIQLLTKINNSSEAASILDQDEGLAKSPAALRQSQWSPRATGAAAIGQTIMPNTKMTRGNSFSVSPVDLNKPGDIMELTTSTGDLPNATWRPSQQFSDPETAPHSHNAEDSIQQLPINDDTPSIIPNGADFDYYNTFTAKSSPQTSSLGMEGLLEAAIAGLEGLGFTSVDSFAEAYYSSSFEESSYLAGEQSMSRKRRLPRMLSQVLDSAQSWDPWDRRGLNEEIFRTAESLLVAEGKSMDEKSLEASIGGLMQAAEGPGKPTRPQQNVGGIKKVLQKELPNLWPLMMALAGGNRAFRQRDRSNVVLAAIIILHGSSKMTKQKLLEFLDVCL
ncbi:hypothetical protein FDECE_16924 [Fusarium decemcellulare]|nr:hypothetical protein FDECE_16924 [Fusarium decemcellulare]